MYIYIYSQKYCFVLAAQVALTFVQKRGWAGVVNHKGKPPPISISLSKPNDVDDKNGSWLSGESGSFPTALFVSLLSSSTIPNTESESSGGRESNVANMGVDGGTNGLLLFNDDDNDDGSCFTIFELTTAIAGELLILVDVVDEEFIGIPLDKHFLSNS